MNIIVTINDILFGGNHEDILMGLIRVFCFKSSSYSTLKVTIVDIDVGGTVMKIQTSWDLICPYMKKTCFFKI